MRYKVVSEILTMCGFKSVKTLMGNMSIDDAKCLCDHMNKQDNGALYTIQVDHD